MKKCLLLISYLVSFIPLSAFATELMKWQRLPLSIDLALNQERVIIIDKNISVGYPVSLHNKIRIQSVGGVLYLKPSEHFSSTRIQLRDNESGEIILLDIKTIKTNQILETIQLVYQDEVYNNQAETGLAENKPHSSSEANSSPVPVILTRYAAQNLYAPLRAIEKLDGVRNVPTHLPKQLTTLLPSQPVSTSPMMSWQLSDYVVTAIKLVNESHQTVHLDPRLLQGNLYAATFQHQYLGPKGQASDTSVVYIVTLGRPDKALLPEPEVKNGIKK